MKNKTFNICLCVASFLILMFYLFKTVGLEELQQLMQSLAPSWLLGAVACMVLYWLLEARVLHLIVERVHKGQPFWKTLRVSMIGQLFNCITPFASGGQPVQAYYMVKDGISLSTAAMALLVKFILYQSVLTIYTLFILIFQFRSLASQIEGFAMLAIVGFVVNSFMIFLLLSAVIFPKPTRKVAAVFVRLLGKLHILKKPDQTLKHLEEEFDNFYDKCRFLKQNPKVLLAGSLESALQLTVYFSIAFMIYKAFGLPGFDYIGMLSAQAFILLISSFVPLPGAMGAAEGSFFLFFGIFFPKGVLNLAMVLWRLITYYLPIVVGSCFTFVTKKSEKKKTA